jgi:radical SAM superfamily enzyme
LQLLHVLQGTELAESYCRGEFEVLTPGAYYELVADSLELLPPNVVVHRLTGDGAKKNLIAPLWSADKKRVLADLNRFLRSRGIARI